MRTLVLLLLSCANAAPTPAPRSQAPDGFWDHWGDGRAELNRYALTQPRYGEQRSGEAVLVFVTEDFDRASRVKTDRPGGFPVIKLNEVRDFTTGIYDYNVLNSAFVPLDGSAPWGQPTKVSLSVQEWCGHVYEQWVIDPAEARVDRHSYFEGEADAREVVQLPAEPVFADSWPIVVRGLTTERVGPGQTLEVDWLEPLLTARFAHQPSVFAKATISRSAETSTIEVPAGSFETWTTTVAVSGGRTSTWWVEAQAPHRLIKWEVSDGETGELTHSIREPYWQMSGTRSEPQRNRLGLTPAATSR